MPARDDPVDKALSQFLTKYPERDRLKILFLRESEGVYQFGQRRVYIKVERKPQAAGPSILVRVGGGFMHIDQFIEQYTKQEVDRIERRRDVLTRFT